MPGGWKLASLGALVAFVAVWAPVTWLATRGGPDGAKPPRPRPAASVDGLWHVLPERSSITTSLASVRRLSGDARIRGRVLLRAHLSGGRATFDLTRPVSLAQVRQGRRVRVSLSGKARFLFLSRGLTVPVGVLWIGDRLTISGRRGDNALHLELAR